MSEQEQDDSWLTPKEAANRIRVHVSTILNFIKRGELPAFQFGTHWRIRERDFNAWMEKQQKKQSQ